MVALTPDRFGTVANPRQQLDYIHGLRGFAAIIVVLQHALQMVHEGGVGWFDPLLMNLNLGRFGVVLFFLISGFVIPYSLRGARPVRDFLISRFLRLYPAYWVSLLALTVVADLTGHHPDVATFLSNITMLQGLWGAENIGPGYWSLLYEMVFYGLCVALFAAGMLRTIWVNAAIAGGLLLVVLGSTLGELFDYEPVGIADRLFLTSLFFTGLMLRRATVDAEPVAWRWSLVLVPMTVAGGLAMGGTFTEMPSNANIYFSPIALSAAMALPVLFFALVLWTRPKVPTLLMYAGTISYSVYLFQDIGLHLLPLTLAPGSWPLTYIATVVTLTTVVAVLVYQFVERPALDLRRRWMARLNTAADPRLPDQPATAASAASARSTSSAVL